MLNTPRLTSNDREVLKIFGILFLDGCSFILNAQEPSKVMSSVFDEALTDRTAYNNLEFLCKQTAGRIAGSVAAEKTVEYTRQALISAGAVNQRTAGASEASKYGASGVIVRSMTQSLDNFPHTGVMRYADGVNKIPAVAVSTSDAELLSQC